MSNWSEVSIDELKASSKNAIAMGPFGSRIKAENFVKSGVPIIKGGNLNGDFILENKFDYLTEEKATELKSSNAFRRDIVITHRGTIGQVGIIPDNSKFERYVVSQSQLKVTLDQEKVNPYFVYYFLRSPLGQHRLLVNASQVGVPAIAQASTSVKGIMVPCPDKDIQDKIVEILLNLDHKIELNRQTNQTLEQIAQAIFKSWFVDFDPVKAKIEAIQNGQDPEIAAMCAISGISIKDAEEQLKALDDTAVQQLKIAAALFPDVLVESELGGIPEGWEAGTLDNLCKLNAKSWTKKNAPAEVWYVDLANTKNGVIEDVQYFSWDDAPSRARRVLREGDTIIGTVRPGNRSFSLVSGASNRLTASTGFAVLSPKKQAYLEFLYISATGDENIDRLAHLADGGAYPAVRPDVVTQMELTIPSEQVMNMFSDMIKPLFQKRNENLHAQDILAELRDALLPRLLSGEIELNNNQNMEVSANG